MTIRTQTLLDRAWAEIAVGRDHRIGGAFERAKDLACAALRELESADLPLTDAQICLATCYWRLGEHDNARTVLYVALAECDGITDRLRLTNALCMVLGSAGEYEEICRLSLEVSPLIEVVTDPYLRGQFHNNYADALRQKKETDAAILECTGAVIRFEEAGHERHTAAARQNLGVLLIMADKASDALEHLERAREVFERVGDNSALAQTYETLACAYEAEGKLEEAFYAAEKSKALLEGGEEAALIGQSRQTHGRILDKLGVERVAALVVARSHQAVAVGIDDALASVASSDDALQVGVHRTEVVSHHRSKE